MKVMIVCPSISISIFFICLFTLGSGTAAATAAEALFFIAKPNILSIFSLPPSISFLYPATGVALCAGDGIECGGCGGIPIKTALQKREHWKCPQLFSANCPENEWIWSLIRIIRLHFLSQWSSSSLYFTSTLSLSVTSDYLTRGSLFLFTFCCTWWVLLVQKTAWVWRQVYLSLLLIAMRNQCWFRFLFSSAFCPCVFNARRQCLTHLVVLLSNNIFLSPAALLISCCRLRGSSKWDRGRQ